MEDGKPDEGDTDGKESVDDSKEDKENTGTAMADKAINAAERLEKANEVTKKNLDRQEALMARQALGGKSEAGKEVDKKTQDELDEEAAKDFMKDDE